MEILSSSNKIMTRLTEIWISFRLKFWNLRKRREGNHMNGNSETREFLGWGNIICSSKRLAVICFIQIGGVLWITSTKINSQRTTFDFPWHLKRVNLACIDRRGPLSTPTPCL